MNEYFKRRQKENKGRKRKKKKLIRDEKECGIYKMQQ